MALATQIILVLLLGAVLVGAQHLPAPLLSPLTSVYSKIVLLAAIVYCCSSNFALALVLSLIFLRLQQVRQRVLEGFNNHTCDLENDCDCTDHVILFDRPKPPPPKPKPQQAPTKTKTQNPPSTTPSTKDKPSSEDPQSPKSSEPPSPNVDDKPSSKADDEKPIVPVKKNEEIKKIDNKIVETKDLVKSFDFNSFKDKNGVGKNFENIILRMKRELLNIVNLDLEQYEAALKEMEDSLKSLNDMLKGILEQKNENSTVMIKFSNGKFLTRKSGEENVVYGIDFAHSDIKMQWAILPHPAYSPEKEYYRIISAYDQQFLKVASVVTRGVANVRVYPDKEWSERDTWTKLKIDDKLYLKLVVDDLNICLDINPKVDGVLGGHEITVNDVGYNDNNVTLLSAVDTLHNNLKEKLIQVEKWVSGLPGFLVSRSQQLLGEIVFYTGAAGHKPGDVNNGDEDTRTKSEQKKQFFDDIKPSDPVYNIFHGFGTISEVLSSGSIKAKIIKTGEEVVGPKQDFVKLTKEKYNEAILEKNKQHEDVFYNITSIQIFNLNYENKLKVFDENLKAMKEIVNILDKKYKSANNEKRAVEGYIKTSEEAINKFKQAHNDRCGRAFNFKKCDGNKCCSGYHYCGGRKGFSSDHCNVDMTEIERKGKKYKYGITEGRDNHTIQGVFTQGKTEQEVDDWINANFGGWGGVESGLYDGTADTKLKSSDTPPTFADCGLVNAHNEMVIGDKCMICPAGYNMDKFTEECIRCPDKYKMDDFLKNNDKRKCFLPADKRENFCKSHGYDYDDAVGCYRCPKGYTRTALSVTDNKACKTDTNQIPDGYDFWDSNADGNYNGKFGTCKTAGMTPSWTLYGNGRTAWGLWTKEACWGKSVNGNEYSYPAKVLDNYPWELPAERMIDSDLKTDAKVPALITKPRPKVQGD